jgi:hypothetical protein
MNFPHNYKTPKEDEPLKAFGLVKFIFNKYLGANILSQK